jgi:hypothetical protein
MENKNEYLLDSTDFEIEFSFLSKNTEDLPKQVPLFLTRTDAYRREAPMGG